MVQLMIISLLFNFIASVVLAENALKDRVPFCRNLAEYYTQRNLTRLIWGILTLAVGVLKLFWTGDQIMILGDLVPAVTGILLGIFLIVDYIKNRSKSDQVQMDQENPDQTAETDGVTDSSFVVKLNRALLRYKTGLGLTGIGVVILHFFLYRIIFF